MKNLIIIGAGGMGRQVFLFAQGCKGYQKDYVIKGFLDDNLDAMDGFDDFPPLLGSVDDYEIQPDDVSTRLVMWLQKNDALIKFLREVGYLSL